MLQVSNGQIDCYKRVIEEGANIDTIENSSGTGFLLTNRGLVITNRHVVANAEQIIATFEIKGKKYKVPLEVLDINKELDLAVLHINYGSDKTLSNVLSEPLPYGFSETPMKMGDKIYVLGYPSPNVLGASIKLTDGIVNATSGFLDNNEMYQISAPIQPGNSGSPVFDIHGNVKGVVVSSYINGQIVNYAIKSKYLKEMLSKIKYRVNGSTTLNSLGGLNSKLTIDFKGQLANISNRVCLIECKSRKKLL
jgi:S1-C subfamily serine protease